MKSVAVGLRPRPVGNGSFHGKRVEFLCDLSGKLLLLTGKFVVPSGKNRGMEIHYTGRIDPRDLPLSEYVFPISARHLNSVVSTKHPSTRPAYFMEKPLQRRLGLTKAVEKNELLMASSAH